jgi:hypothetical protein
MYIKRTELLRLVLERRDLATQLPKLYVVAVHELLGHFFGDPVIFAEEIDCLTNLAVRPKNVCSIFCHFRSPGTEM